MNRLTERIDGIVMSKERYEKYSPCHHCKYQSTSYCLEENCTYGSTLDRLAEYEEQGILIELPCKVGSTAFQIVGDEIEKLMVGNFHLNGISELVMFIKTDGETFLDYADLFGEEFFLTREDAEEALRGRR